MAWLCSSAIAWRVAKLTQGLRPREQIRKSWEGNEGGHQGTAKALGGGANEDAPLQEVVDGVDGAVVILLPLKCSESMETATPAADGSTTSGTLDDWLVPCEFMHRSR